MPPRITRKSYRPRASDRTMVGIFCNRTACRIRNRRRRHDSNMTLRKKRTPRASLHYLGWRAWQTSMLLPVAGEVFLLTFPFIERRYRKFGVLAWYISDKASTRPLISASRRLRYCLSSLYWKSLSETLDARMVLPSSRRFPGRPSLT